MKKRKDGWCDTCEQLVWYVPSDDLPPCPDCGTQIVEVDDE